jgi:hypothetical protein
MLARLRHRRVGALADARVIILIPAAHNETRLAEGRGERGRGPATRYYFTRLGLRELAEQPISRVRVHFSGGPPRRRTEQRVDSRAVPANTAKCKYLRPAGSNDFSSESKHAGFYNRPVATKGCPGECDGPIERPVLLAAAA